jgi:16S rRNA (guanine527-N7)-methyltransferase
MWREELSRLGASRAGIEKGERFIKELERWNRVHKLTNYRGEEIGEQILDSVYPFLKWELYPQKVVDIGTGAGFPGLVVSFFLPKTHFFLLEPIKKRASFLFYIKTLLKLSNVEVVPKRVEEFTTDGVELITSRAVADWDTLLSISRHLVGEETRYLLYRGSPPPLLPFPTQLLIREKRSYLLFSPTQGG